MIQKNKMILYKREQNEILPIQVDAGLIIIDHITEVNYYIGTTIITSNQVINCKLDLDNLLTITEACFNMKLYNTLEIGMPIEKNIIKGHAVDVRNPHDLLEFYTSFDNLKVTDLLMSLNMDSDMTIEFEAV